MAKAKSGHNTVATVEALVRPVVEGMGLSLWDVRFEKEGPDWFLRVLIDRDTPLDTDTCEAVSRAVDPILDEADLIQQSYYLEVGRQGPLSFCDRGLFDGQSRKGTGDRRRGRCGGASGPPHGGGHGPSAVGRPF